jgi:hypothetical protein
MPIIDSPMHESHPKSTNRKGSDIRQKLIIAGAVLLVLLLLAGIGLAVAAMLRAPGQTETIRDIVIIFVAAETFLIGLTLILVLVQVARLTALVEHEIRPILESTTETVSTLRGTTAFLSRNLVRPVIKANSTLAAIKHAAGMFGRKRPRA